MSHTSRRVAKGFGILTDSSQPVFQQLVLGRSTDSLLGSPDCPLCQFWNLQFRIWQARPGYRQSPVPKGRVGPNQAHLLFFTLGALLPESFLSVPLWGKQKTLTWRKRYTPIVTFIEHFLSTRHRHEAWVFVQSIAAKPQNLFFAEYTPQFPRHCSSFLQVLWGVLYHPQEACEQFWKLNLLFIPFPAIPRKTVQKMQGRSVCIMCPGE